MDLVGTLTVELFLLRDGSLVVNELAPRVHNSGHWTIEGGDVQFEQHLRAICGLPLARRQARSDGDRQRPGPARNAKRACWASTRRSRARHPLLHLYDKRRCSSGEEPRDRTWSEPTGGPRPRPSGRLRWADAASPRVGVVGGRLGLPGARGRRHGPRRARRSVRAAGRVRSPHPDHLFRYAETAAEQSGDHRGAGGAAHLPACSPRRRRCR